MGTFVRAEIQGLRAEDVVVLPRSVLQADDTVLVANDDRVLEIRKVNVVRAEPRRVYIDGGVEGGELVVTTSMDAPIPGTRLAITGEDPPEPEEPDTENEIASTGDRTMNQGPYASLITWFARNSVAANLLMVILLVGGFYTVLTIKKEIQPRIDTNYITVTVPVPGRHAAGRGRRRGDQDRRSHPGHRRHQGNRFHGQPRQRPGNRLRSMRTTK